MLQESLEHRVRDLEHHVAELIRENYETQLLSLALFASHPDRQYVLDCYEFLRAHWTELSSNEPLSEPMLGSTERAAQEFAGLLSGLMKVDIPKVTRPPR